MGRTVPMDQLVYPFPLFTGFSKSSNQIKHVKYENGIFQGLNFAKGRFDDNEQLWSLVKLQNPTGFHVIKFGTNSNLNLPWIFKGSNLWEKSGKFTKITSWYDLP
jgi:hypothetical protein